MSLEYNIEETYPEQVWKNDLPTCPAYIVDFQVFCHGVFNFLESNIQLELYRDQADDIIKSLWAIKLNRGPDMLPEMPFTCIIVDDYKGEVDSSAAKSSEGYWRHIVAQEYGLQEYKIGRSTKPTLFYKVRDIGLDYITGANSPFYYFKQVYMEADDLAGKFARLKRLSSPETVAASRELILGTVDGDWQGLVSDKHRIIWANTGPWLPRLRDEKAVCDYYLRKNKYKITKARESYDVKVVCGDAGDGLKPGSPLRLFNLYDEDCEYNFSEDTTEQMRAALNDPNPSNRPDHLRNALNYLGSLGIIPPLAPQLDPHDQEKALEKAKKERERALKTEAVGRLRKICEEIEAADPIAFEKCAELSQKDQQALQDSKDAKEALSRCERSDNECLSFYKTLLKTLKTLRDGFKKTAVTLTKAILRG